MLDGQCNSKKGRRFRSDYGGLLTFGQLRELYREAQGHNNQAEMGLIAAQVRKQFGKPFMVSLLTGRPINFDDWGDWLADAKLRRSQATWSYFV